MSQVVLILGGTNVLERSIQAASGQAPVVVGTVEELLAKVAQQPNAVVVLGPTYRRALAAVGQIRPEGKTQPPILVIYRDDQKDEVKRHQKSKTVADKYVQQSRANKDLEPALQALLAAEVLAGEIEEIDTIELLEGDEVILGVDLVEEIEDDVAELDNSGLELVEDDVEDILVEDVDIILDDEPMAATVQMDVVTLSADALEDDATTPMPGEQVLGELDVEELDTEEMVHTLEPEAIELTDDGEELEEVLDGAVLEEEQPAEDEAQSLDADDLQDDAPSVHELALEAELQELRAKLTGATAHIATQESQNAELQTKLAVQSAQAATLQEQLKAARGQIAALQTKMVDCRIQAEEAAGIVKALAAKLG
jgi:hypothetical protein